MDIPGDITSFFTLEQLSPTDAQAILDRLPERIRTALRDDLRSVVDRRATEIEYPMTYGRS
jgi:hypothetical protein